MDDRGLVQSSGDFSLAEIQAVYNRSLLKEVTPMVWTDRYAQVLTIEKNKGTTQGVARRYKNILPATTPLGEITSATVRTGNKVVFEKINYDIKKYGDFIVMTEENELFNLDDIRAKYLSLQARQAAVTANELTKDKIMAGTNIIYANGVADRTAAAAETIKESDLDLAEIILDNQGAQRFTSIVSGSRNIGTTPIDAAYIGVAHTSVIKDISKLNGWVAARNYPNIGVLLPNERGSVGAFRWINDTEGRTVDAGGNTVFQTLVFGKDAYAQITLRGSSNLKTIMRPKHIAGGPLEEYETLGWKMWHGATITNENWLIRLESGAGIVDGSPKHYYDYS